MQLTNVNNKELNRTFCNITNVKYIKLLYKFTLINISKFIFMRIFSTLVIR